jgi:hypothetical protein
MQPLLAESPDLPVEESFIQDILSPYQGKSCIYLKGAVHSFNKKASTQARFSIAESCYIDSTGHFNSVELNICYNQMFYLLWADGVRRRLIPEVSEWDVRTFKERQLPGMLIARMRSGFRRPIDPAEVYAEGHIDRVRVLGKPPRSTLFLHTHATFSDALGGIAHGEADFAIVP